MAKDIQDYVAENRRRLRSINSRFQEIATSRSTDLSFGDNYFTTTVDVDVYTRPTGSQVVFGHPDASKGFGRGTFGDDKGQWSQVADTSASAEFTKDGRKAAAEALNGKTGAVVDGGVGGDTTTAATGDASLGTETGRSFAWASASAGTLTATSVYESTEVAGVPGEFGLFDDDGRLLARVTIDTSGLSVSSTDEVRGVVTVAFEGDGNGSSVVTTDGEQALAASLASPKAVVGPNEFAFGSGSTGFTKSDSSLTTEEFRKTCGRESGRDRVDTFTRVTASDMTQTVNDLTEMAVYDNKNRMIWAVTFRAVPSDSPGFDADTSFVVV